VVADINIGDSHSAAQQERRAVELTGDSRDFARQRDEIDSATAKTSRTQRLTLLYMNQNDAKGPKFREDMQESAVQQRKRTEKDVTIRNGRKGKHENKADTRQFSRRPSPNRLTRHSKRSSRRPYFSSSSEDSDGSISDQHNRGRCRRRKRESENSSNDSGDTMTVQEE